MLCKELIAIWEQMKHLNTLCGSVRSFFVSGREVQNLHCESKMTKWTQLVGKARIAYKILIVKSTGI
jgi:hypothetical protein